MKPYPYEGEVRLLRWGESSTAGRTITLELPPDAGDVHPFKGFSVGTKTGQRFRMLFAVILDDETTPEPPAQAEAPARNPDRSEKAREAYAMKDRMAQAAQRAAMLCKDRAFQDWLFDTLDEYFGPEVDAAHREFWTAKAMRDRLKIDTRSKIASSQEAYDGFLAIELAYRQSQGQFAEARG